MQKDKRICSSPLEKFMYGVGDVGANLCWTFMGSFITMYYTDSAGIAAATAGLIMLIARLLDGVSDVFGAFIMEHTDTRWGKIRPWFWIAAPLMGIGLYLSFHCPMNVSDHYKTVYAFVTYTFTGAIAYTIYNLAFTAILPLMSLDPDDRNQTSAIQRIICVIGLTIMLVVSPILIGLWGGEKSTGAWHTISTIYAILCTLIVFLMGVVIKEKDAELIKKEDIVEEVEEVKTTLGQKIKYTLNKYTIIVLVFFIAMFMSSSLISGINAYYSRDVLGNINIMSIISFGSLLPMIFVLPFCPALFRRFGKKKVVMVGIICNGILSCIRMIFATNIVAFVVLFVFATISTAPMQAAMYTFISDVVDYLWGTKRIRAEGFVAMASSVGVKLGSGFASAIVGWGLALGGYDAGLAVQKASTLFAEKLIMNFGPVIMAVIMLLCMILWDIDKYRKEK